MFGDQRFFAGVYWGDRRESIDESAARVARLLTALGRLGSDFERWYFRKESRGESTERVELSAPDALRASMAERMYEPGEHDPYGFMVELWNGVDDQAMDLDVTVGAHLGLAHCPAPNACVVQLPRDVGTEHSRLDPARLVEVLGELVEVMEADWGLVSTNERLGQTAMQIAPGAPHVGWITFLSHRRGRLPSPPSPARVTSHPRGNLLVLDGPAFDEAAADRVEEFLTARGLLKAVGSYREVASPPVERGTERAGALDLGHAVAQSFLHHALRACVGTTGFVLGDGALASRADLQLLSSEASRAGRPDVAIEVVSAKPDLAREDRIERVSRHAAAGVPHVWLLDPTLRSLEVLELDADGRYVRVLAATDGSVSELPGCPTLVLALDVLWAELDRLTNHLEP